MKAIGGKSLIVVFLISHMWLEVAIKESDGLIAVISEKYMHSTYCNNGISLCAQQQSTYHQSCLQKWSWHRAQDYSSSQFFFEVSAWHLAQTHSSFVVSLFSAIVITPRNSIRGPSRG